MIELRHIRYFVVLAEELHFGRAAKRLHIAQPGLTYQIKALESVLGVLLLDRNRRRVELTHAGQILLEEGRRALTQAERAENLSRRAGSGEIGRLTIGATESAAWDLLPELIAEFHKRHKAVDLVIREMTSRMQLDALRNGEIDVGFLRAPVDTEGLVARVIRQEKLSSRRGTGQRTTGHSWPSQTFEALRHERNTKARGHKTGSCRSLDRFLADLRFKAGIAAEADHKISPTWSWH